MKEHGELKNPVFNPVTEKTYQFFAQFFEEMAGLFPDEYMHIGGDENNGVHWNSNDEITDFMSKNGMTSILELQNYFNKRILEIASSYNKKLMGWDEILQPGLPKKCCYPILERSRLFNRIGTKRLLYNFI